MPSFTCARLAAVCAERNLTGTRTCEVEIESQLARYIEPSGSVGPPQDLARSQDRRTQNLGGEGHAQKWTNLTFPILKQGHDRRSSQRSQNIVYCIYVFRRELSAQFPWWHSFQIAASHGILLPCEIVKHQFPASYLDFQGPRRAGDIQSSFCRCVAFGPTLSSLALHGWHLLWHAECLLQSCAISEPWLYPTIHVLCVG